MVYRPWTMDYSLNRYRCFNSGMWVVILYSKILEGKIENRFKICNLKLNLIWIDENNVPKINELSKNSDTYLRVFFQIEHAINWYKIFEYLKNENNLSVNALISAHNISVINLYSFFDFKFKESYIGYRKLRKTNFKL